jgi:hypothetical protein
MINVNAKKDWHDIIYLCTSTPTGLIIPVINNDLFLTVIQAQIQKFFKGGF